MRNASNAQNRRSNGSHDIQIHYAAGDRSSVHSAHNLNFTQQQINAALFNSNSPSYSVAPIASTSADKHYQNQDLHMAEILVESAVGQQRSAFQFDTITPKKKTAPPNSTDYNDAPLSSVMMDSGIEIPSTSTEVTKESSTNHDSSKEDSSAKSSSESDDNGGFVTPEEGQGSAKSHHRVKRATVVGNPMFSASQDSEIAATGENLGLDDLDYDDIMHYFDNLKVNKR